MQSSAPSQGPLLQGSGALTLCPHFGPVCRLFHSSNVGFVEAGPWLPLAAGPQEPGTGLPRVHQALCYAPAAEPYSSPRSFVWLHIHLRDEQTGGERSPMVCTGGPTTQCLQLQSPSHAPTPCTPPPLRQGPCPAQRLVRGGCSADMAIIIFNVCYHCE